MDEIHFPYPHHADLDIFREALAHSEAVTGFTATLIEKDYYCSLVLKYFFDMDTSLVFKGGTCLSKVHTDFYRLSEDLDLIIPIAVHTTRTQRRAEMEPVKRIFDKLPTVIPGVAVVEPFRGHNESRQYIGYIEYGSAVIQKQEGIKLEVGIREPLISPPVYTSARTIAVNPFSGEPLLSSFTVRAMAIREAYAEKLRAALTRREPAIRDFFDLFYAVREVKLDFNNTEFINTLMAKLQVPGNEPVDVSAERKRELDRQLEGQLRPVLRPADFVRFNLDEAFELVRKVAETIPTGS
jgi:predicted nucleotidyltransferase component of viral defense system